MNCTNRSRKSCHSAALGTDQRKNMDNIKTDSAHGISIKKVGVFLVGITVSNKILHLLCYYHDIRFLQQEFRQIHLRVTAC